MALGLLISALAGGLDRAATLLPMVLVTQVIVSAPLFSPPGDILRTAGYLSAAQWGMAASASTLDLHRLRTPYVYITEKARVRDGTVNLTDFDRPTWHHELPIWVTNLGFLAALTVLGLAGAWYALRSTDPDLMEGRHARRKSPRRLPVPGPGPAAPAAPAGPAT
jgi:hypothetical protein